VSEQEGLARPPRPGLGRAAAVAIGAGGLACAAYLLLGREGVAVAVVTVVAVFVASLAFAIVPGLWRHPVSADIVERRRAKLELTRLAAAIECANDAVMVSDADGRAVYVNPAFERLTGVPVAQVIGQPISTSERPGARALNRAIGEVATSLTPWRGDLRDRNPDGGWLTLETTLSPILSGAGELVGFVTIKRDVTRERANERAAERQARERALVAETLEALAAGRTLEATAQAVCAQVVRLPEAVLATLITFDPDGTASVIGQVARGDGGHAGVRLPAARSAYLRERGTGGPWVEHWRPEPDHPYRSLLEVLDVRAHAYAPLTVHGDIVGLLILGSSCPDAVTRLVERLPALAEFAAITSALMAPQLANRLTTARTRAMLRRVIDERAFCPVFQPIVELRSGAARGYEALTRFDDGAAPEERFAEAGSVGLGIELEMACLGAALEAAERLPDDVWLNINASPELVLSGELEPLLAAQRRLIVVEITEHEAITDYDAFRVAVRRLDGGIRICVDDAGAGFASLRHIVELEPAFVKLDRSLIAGLGSDGARQAMVTGMAHFATAAGMQLIAEGLETDSELTAVRLLGVPLGQGYLLGRPEVLPAVQPSTRPIARLRRRDGAPRLGAAVADQVTLTGGGLPAAAGLRSRGRSPRWARPRPAGSGR
jgi:PAS domain S-box-containing protein